MPTRWHYRLGEEEFGPVKFRQLVGLVRAGVISRETMVRSSWDENWRWADHVPGLFYLAQRDSPIRVEPVHAAAPEAAPHGHDDAELLDASTEQNGWDAQTNAWNQPDRTAADAVAVWSAVVSAALEHAEVAFVRRADSGDL